jgi:hypothetical protein
MPKYLVGFSESQFQEQEFKIINASSESEAVATFIKVFAITDDVFLEDVYDRSINASFAERFWLQTEDEEIVFHETGEIVIDDEEFKRRVRSFFGQYRIYAERYLDHYFSEQGSSKTHPFPEEMLIYIWANSDFSNVTAIKLDQIEEA